MSSRVSPPNIIHIVMRCSLGLPICALEILRAQKAKDESQQHYPCSWIPEYEATVERSMNLASPKLIYQY